MKKINLCISNKCFLHCKGCYNDFCNNKELSYEELVPFLEYAKRNGLEKVTLSGGDPFTKKDILMIINKCIELNLIINIDTVGFNILNKVGKYDKINVLDFIDKINLLSIPLDGSNNELNYEFRQYKNLFDEITKLLNYFEKNRVKIGINTVAHQKNIKDLKKIYNIISKYDCVKKWQIFQYMPIGINGEKYSKEFSINSHQVEYIKKEIKKMKSNFEIQFKTFESRIHNSLLINSIGEAYRVNENNTKDIYGNVKDSQTWEMIMNNI